MNSEVSICNSALDILGANEIISLDEDTKEARLCKRNYPLLLAECLSSHYWNFSVKRVQLAKLPTPPLYEFDNLFSLPGDCVRVINIDSEREEFKVEGRNILTNDDTVFIKYVSNATNAAFFSPQFVEALAYKLAAKLAYPLVQSVSLSRELTILADNKLKEARGTDGQEGSPEKLQRDEWLDSRVLGGTPHRVSTDLES